jgi:hypothetical protein
MKTAGHEMKGNVKKREKEGEGRRRREKEGEGGRRREEEGKGRRRREEGRRAEASISIFCSGS